MGVWGGMVLVKRCGAEAAESDCGHFIRSRRKKKRLGEKNELKSTVEKWKYSKNGGRFKKINHSSHSSYFLQR